VQLVGEEEDEEEEEEDLEEDGGGRRRRRGRSSGRWEENTKRKKLGRFNDRSLSVSNKHPQSNQRARRGEGGKSQFFGKI